MPTKVRGKDILLKTINKDHFVINKTGLSVVTNLVPGMGINLQSTGIDVGTGEVTINSGYHHIQTIVSNTWTIIHNLNKLPQVVSVDSENNEVIGSVSFPSLNEVTITFSADVSGQAYLT